MSKDRATTDQTRREDERAAGRDTEGRRQTDDGLRPRTAPATRVGGNTAMQRRLAESGVLTTGAGREEMSGDLDADGGIGRRLDERCGSGRPLPEHVRTLFERQYESALDDVRVHDDRAAAELSRALGARAFTFGRQIFFGRETYEPGSTAGLALLGHELAHTVQQERATPVDAPTMVPTDAPSERDAATAAAGGRGGPTVRLYAAAIQRSSEARELVSSQTNLFGNLDEEALGASLLQRALGGEYGFVQEVLDELGFMNRDDVSFALVEDASDAQLDRLASNPQGRRLLDRLYDELTGGSLSEEEQTQSDRILQAKSRRISPESFQQDVQDAMTFPFRPPGITVFDDAPIAAERRSGGTVWVEMPVRVLASSTYRAETQTLPDEVFISGIEIPEDRIVGIKRYDQGGTVQYRPALYLVRLSNETTTEVYTTMGEAAGYGLSLGTMGALGAGAKGMSFGARALLWIDRAAAAIGVLGTLVGDHRGWIIRTFGDSGRQFVRWVEIVNSAVALYDLGTVAISMGRTVNSLRRAYSEWRQVRRGIELNGDEAEVADSLTENTDEFLEGVDRAAESAEGGSGAASRGLPQGGRVPPARQLPSGEPTSPRARGDIGRPGTGTPSRQRDPDDVDADLGDTTGAQTDEQVAGGRTSPEARRAANAMEETSDPTEFLDQLRNLQRSSPPPRGSAGRGWPWDRMPTKPARRWQPGDPIDMPTERPSGKSRGYPTYDDTARKRYWRNRAHFELEARARGTATREEPSAFDPLRSMSEAELEEIRNTGTAPTVRNVPGEPRTMELEHMGAPQRVRDWLEAAGLSKERARRLARTSDPSTLMEVSPLEHAFFDAVAQNFGTRSDVAGANWEYTELADVRVDRPLARVPDRQIRDIVRALEEEGISLADLEGESARNLWSAIRREIEERGLDLSLP